MFFFAIFKTESFWKLRVVFVMFVRAFMMRDECLMNIFLCRKFNFELFKLRVECLRYPCGIISSE